MPDTFASMTELIRAVGPAHYSIQACRSLGTHVKLFAPHGGCIEPCTAAIALALAENLADIYLFHGLLRRDCFRTLHVTSSHYDEPQCLEMIAETDIALAIHGCEGEEPFVLVGGGNLRARDELLRMLTQCGLRTSVSSGAMKGEDPSNFINRARHKGVQLELSSGFRRTLYRRYPRPEGRDAGSFQPFISTVRKWIDDTEQSLSFTA